MYVCCCFGVRASTIEDAIDRGAHTVEAVRAITCASSRCGSCRPEIAQMIADRLGQPLAPEQPTKQRHLRVVRRSAA